MWVEALTVHLYDAESTSLNFVLQQPLLPHPSAGPGTEKNRSQ